MIAAAVVAIVRGVPDSFTNALRRHAPESPIDVGKARRQHRRYVEEIARLARVIEIPADERFPDCCFVEDTAVVIGGRAVLNRLGAPSRRGEEERVGETLAALGLESLRMPEGATLDGGDVLFTGRELFVGRSSRTNEAGIDFLATAFPAIPIHRLDLPSGLHLKSVVSPIGGERFAVYREARSVFAGIARVIPHARPLWIPDPPAANCLVIGGTLLHLASHRESCARYATLPHRRVPLDMSEFEKADGGLTCLSIVIPSLHPSHRSVR